MADDVIRLVDIKYTTSGADQAVAANKKVSDSFDGVTVASDKTSKATLSTERSYESLQKKYDVVYRATQQQTAEMAKLDAARKQGLVSDERYVYLQGQIAQGYQNTVSGANKVSAATSVVTQTAGLARHELVNLSRQAQDVAVSLGSGQSFGTVLLQQGIQIADVFANSQGTVKGFFSQVAEGAAKILTPARLATAGIIGLGAAALYIGNNWHEASAQIERSVIGIGRGTGESLASLNKFSSDNASLTGLSVAQARNIATEFTKTGAIAVSGLKGVGDAIHGYTVLTGKDATEATKDFAGALSGDLVEGAKKIDQVYGVLNSSTLEYIRTLELQGNRSAAVQVILDKIAPANERAAASVGILSKAYIGFSNIISNVFNGVPSSNSDQDKLAALQKQRTEVTTSPSLVGSNPGGYGLLNTGALAGGKSQQLAEIDQQIEALQKKVDAFNASKVVAQLNAMSVAGDAVVKSVIPQIDQINNLQKALVTLQNAQNTPGVSRALGQDDAAVTAIQNQIAALQDAQGQSERYNQRVAEISQSWGNVGQSTALSLQAAQNMQPVYEAVGGAARIAAQYTADYKTAIDAGKTATEATALATSNWAASLAQVNSAAQLTLASMRDQQAVAGAITGQQQIQAQSRATYNDLLRQGVDASTASAVASQQEANSREKATANALRQAQALSDSTEMIKAQQNGTEATTAAAIAYTNAIKDGASATAAAALSAATLENYLTKAAVAAQQMEQAQLDKINYQTNGVYDPSKNPGPQTKGTNVGSMFAPETMTQSGSFGLEYSEGRATYKSGQGRGNVILGYVTDNLIIQKQFDAMKAKKAEFDKQVEAQLAAITATSIANGALATGGLPAAIQAVQGSRKSDTISTAGSLYQLLNAQTSDKSAKIGNLQSEMSWLQTLPSTIERNQAIVALQQAMDQLRDSVDANTDALNNVTLNPLYNGRSALRVGYYKAASGYDGVVSGGIPGVDSVPINIMAQQGERVQVHPVGWQNAPTAANSNGSGPSQTIINQTNNFSSGGGRDDRLSELQLAQGFGRVASAMSGRR